MTETDAKKIKYLIRVPPTIKRSQPMSSQIKKDVADLLTISFSRSYGPTKIKKFKESPVGSNLDSSKSVLYCIDSFVCSDKYPVIEIPSMVAVKKHAYAVRRTSESHRKSCQQEYEMEKEIFTKALHYLHHKNKKREIIVYPKIYSPETFECDNGRYIFREYLVGETLEQIAEKESNENRFVDWEKIKAFYPIALLHIKSPLLLKKIPMIKEVTNENHLSYLAHYIARISRFMTGKRLGVETILRDISEPWGVITDAYFTNKEFSSVINSDLDNYPNHLLPERLLDGASTVKDSFLRDLGFYGDPVFASVKDGEQKVEDIEQKVIKEYLEVRNNLEDELRFPISKFNLDELSLGLCAVFIRGNYRRAASIINYKERALEDSIVGSLVFARIIRNQQFWRKLEEGGGFDVKVAVEKIRQKFKEWGVDYGEDAESLKFFSNNRLSKKKLFFHVTYNVAGGFYEAGGKIIEGFSKAIDSVKKGFRGTSKILYM